MNLNTIRRPSRRLARWITEFQEWKLKIKYRQGLEATLPDALSRRPDYNQQGSDAIVPDALLRNYQLGSDAIVPALLRNYH